MNLTERWMLVVPYEPQLGEPSAGFYEVRCIELPCGSKRRSERVRFERPPVVETAGRWLHTVGLSHRCDVLDGDFFDSILSLGTASAIARGSISGTRHTAGGYVPVDIV